MRQTCPKSFCHDQFYPFPSGSNASVLHPFLHLWAGTPISVLLKASHNMRHLKFLLRIAHQITLHRALFHQVFPHAKIFIDNHGHTMCHVNKCLCHKLGLTRNNPPLFGIFYKFFRGVLLMPPLSSLIWTHFDVLKSNE